MFSMYVWHIHNVETLLKLFLGILGRQLRTFFEIIAKSDSEKVLKTLRVGVSWCWLQTLVMTREHFLHNLHQVLPHLPLLILLLLLLLLHQLACGKLELGPKFWNLLEMKNQGCPKLFPKTQSRETACLFCVAKMSSHPIQLLLMLINSPTARDRAHVHHQPDSSLLWGTYLDSKLLLWKSRWQNIKNCQGAWIAHDSCNHENRFCSTAMLRSFQWWFSSQSGLIYSVDGDL